MLYNTRLNKRNLESVLEQIPGFSTPKRSLEQYVTPSNLAAEILWLAYMHGDVSGKTIADLGCGTLRLAIGALILGAKRVLAIDIDCSVLTSVLRINENFLKIFGHKIIMVCSDVREAYTNHVDTVIMNPPFGVYRKNRGLDIIFLKKAFEIANSVYSIHKYSPGLHRLVQVLSDSYGFRIIDEKIRDLMIPMIFKTHTRRIYRVKAVIYIFRKS